MCDAYCEKYIRYADDEMRYNKMGLMLISIAVVLFIAYSVLGWTLYFMQPTFLYGPVREAPYTPGEL